MSQRTRAGGRKGSDRFSEISPPRVQRSTFDLTHTHKTTMDSGYLIPLLYEEMLPGDTIACSPEFFVRFASPLEKPYMDGVRLDWQAFFVPNRLVWDNWVRMMGERTNPDDHNDYTVPQMPAPIGGGGHVEGTLADYFGIPTRTQVAVSALPFRAYNLIYNEWYRDANLQDSVVLDTDDGPDSPTDYVLLRRGKRKDYVSGALPFQQRGEAVQLPLGDSAPLQGIANVEPSSANSAPVFRENISGPIGTLQVANSGTNVGNVDLVASGGTIFSGGTMFWQTAGLAVDNSQVYADLSSAVAANINDMRNAISLQHALERDARGGGRYREQVLVTFGVETDDIRLMRPQVLGVGSLPISPHQVPQTSETTGTSQLGDLAAFGVGAGGSRRFNYSATEHGMVLLLASVRADLTWQKFVDRRFTRESRFDFFHPDLALIGEQAVESREVWSDGTGDPALGTGDFSVWGYQPRWEEMRHRRSLVTGQFRSDYSGSLDVWHLALDFATRPELNDAFIQEDPPIERVIVLQDEPQFLVDVQFNIRMVRPMPMRSKPGLTRF